MRVPNFKYPVNKAHPFRVFPAMTITTDITIRDRAQALIKGLSKHLYEREEPVKLALLSAVAGESIFLLGPPGVGKSLIARRLKYAFRDGTAFEYLMSKFSTPDEVFGPVSIKKLKEEDKYERLTDRYLPGANIVFLDEIWKAGPAIQNALLTILNEKIYKNGETDIEVDIKAIITASNELPPRDHSLDPLWDRFLVRYEMVGVNNKKAFLSMITDTEDVYEDSLTTETKVSTAELEQWDTLIDQVEVPAEVQNTIQVVRLKLDEYNAKPNTEKPIKVYDRRWKKMVRLMRTSAFLNGRQKVDLMDCFLMVHCLWTHPDQRSAIQGMVSETIRKHGYSIAINLGALRREIDELERDITTETRIERVITESIPKAEKEEYYELLDQNKPFDGTYVRISEFNSLLMEESVVNVYDENLSLLRRLKAKRSAVENAIDIGYNGVNYTIPLKTMEAERSERITKKPHRLVGEFWDKRIADLLSYIGAQRKRLDDERPDELNHTGDNLFVDGVRGDIVKANLEEVAETLDKLRLRVEKAQHAYSSL